MGCGNSAPTSTPAQAPAPIVVKEENTFLVTLEKVFDDVKIGMLTLQPESKYLAVETIKEEGLVADWNAANPEVQILLGDIVVAVNDTSGDSKAMLELFKWTGTLTLKVMRADGAPPPAPVPERSPEPKEPEPADVPVEPEVPEVPVEPEAAPPTKVEPPQVIEAVAVPVADEPKEVPADTSKGFCCF